MRKRYTFGEYERKENIMYKRIQLICSLVHYFEVHKQSR